MGPIIAVLTVLMFLAGGIFILYALGGLLIVQPRTKVVVLRFGKYLRTIEHEGMNYVFPFGRTLYRISSQLTTVDLPRMIVVEANGNPIEVAAMCVFRVREAERAVLNVDGYQQFVLALASVVVRNVCSQYPYENPDPEKPCLKKESERIRKHLIVELGEHLKDAGIEIHDLRLNDLAYTPEIAQAMLLRQQAMAMVDARRTLVEGAVSTVQGALQQMADAGLTMPERVVESFASNLMLVLCSGERVQTVMPIEVNAMEKYSAFSAEEK
jgi:regulator of protease activity HflC (stomatin/prohibitin superfamily)